MHVGLLLPHSYASHFPWIDFFGNQAFNLCLLYASDPDFLLTSLRYSTRNPLLLYASDPDFLLTSLRYSTRNTNAFRIAACSFCMPLSPTWYCISSKLGTSPLASSLPAEVYPRYIPDEAWSFCMPLSPTHPHQGYTSAGRLLARGEVPNLLLIQYLLYYTHPHPRQQETRRSKWTADVCWRMLTYADLCWRMLTYADVSQAAGDASEQMDRDTLMLTYADECWRMLTYADVCWRMLTYADYADVSQAAEDALEQMDRDTFANEERQRGIERERRSKMPIIGERATTTSIRQHTSAYVSIRQHTSAYARERDAPRCR